MTHSVGGLVSVVWLRWSDLNRRPLGCEASTCRGVTTRQTRPVRPQKCAPRRRPARRRRQPVVFQYLGDRASRDAVIEVPQRALDATVAPRWILRGHPQNERRDLLHDPRTARPLPLERPLPGCHRRIVSGVTMVATRLRTRRPSRWPFAARRRRWSSVNRMRRPSICSLRIRFSPPSTRELVIGGGSLIQRVTSSSRKGVRWSVIGRSYPSFAKAPSDSVDGDPMLSRHARTPGDPRRGVGGVAIGSYSGQPGLRGVDRSSGAWLCRGPRLANA